jgi:hypothetical protein
MARTRRTKSDLATEAPPPDADALREFLASRFYSPAARAAVLAAKSDNDAQTSLRLPQAMYDALTKAADAHGLGIGEEIRVRLETSFVYEAQAGDDETRRLLKAIETVARNVEPPFGAWHQSRFAFDTFRAAVLALIDLHRPGGVPVRPDDNEIADMYLGEGGTSETAGRMLAGGAATAAGIPMPGQRLRQERK